MSLGPPLPHCGLPPEQTWSFGKQMVPMAGFCAAGKWACLGHMTQDHASQQRLFSWGNLIQAQESSFFFLIFGLG